MAESRKTSCLLIVLDLNPYFWGARSLTTEETPSSAPTIPSSSTPATSSTGNVQGSSGASSQIELGEFLSVLSVFLNAYRLMNKESQIRVIGSHLRGATLIVDNTKTGSAFHRHLQKGIKRLAAHTVPTEAETTDKEPEVGSKLGAALALGICIGNRLIRDDISPRIMVFQASPDVSEQYISVMNCIFSAQKLKILIDSCILYEKDSSLLQQAAYITGGVYMKPESQKQALIQYLMCAYLADADARHYLKVPLLQSVDFRASCFCHKESKDIAFVCSVCLSIFCTFIPVCPTCQVKFPFVL